VGVEGGFAIGLGADETDCDESVGDSTALRATAATETGVSAIQSLCGYENSLVEFLREQQLILPNVVGMSRETIRYFCQQRHHARDGGRLGSEVRVNMTDPVFQHPVRQHDSLTEMHQTAGPVFQILMGRTQHFPHGFCVQGRTKKEELDVTPEQVAQGDGQQVAGVSR